MPSFTEVLHAVHDAWVEQARRGASNKPTRSPRRCASAPAAASAVQVDRLACTDERGDVRPVPRDRGHAARRTTTTASAVSAARRSSRSRRCSTRCWSASLEGNDEAAPPRRARSTRWRRAASTTTSAAASPATRWTARWLVPHFEKMLYDQAGFVRVYTHGAPTDAATRGTAASSSAPSATCCATCVSPAAGSRRPKTPTAKATKACSKPGHRAEIRASPPRRPRSTNDVMRVLRRRPTAATSRAATSSFRPLDADPTVPARIAAATETLFAARSNARPSTARRQGHHRDQRDVHRRARRGRRRVRPPDWIAAAAEIAEFLLANLRRADGRWLQRLAGRGRRAAPRGGRRRGVARRCVHPPRRGHRRAAVDRTRRAPPPNRLLDLFWDEPRAACSPSVATRRRWSPTRRKPSTAPPRRPTPSARSPWPVLAALTGEDLYDERAPRRSSTAFPIGEHPAGFSHATFRRPPARARAATEVVIPGRADVDCWSRRIDPRGAPSP